MKKYGLHFVVIVLCVNLLAAITATGGDFPNNKSDKIDELMSKYNEFKYFNGTVLVAEKGKVIFEKGYGMANFDWGIPNDVNTKFRIGSITKQFVSMIVMQLVGEGKIKLDAAMTEYIPDYRRDTGDKVTIHHLLTHTSGIPSYTGLPGFWSDSTRNSYSLDYMTEHFLSGDFEFEPGSQYRYNNSGYYLLGIIIEKVTGNSLSDELQKRIFDPVGMSNTGIDQYEVILKNRATGYVKGANDLIREPYFHMENAYAAGAMYSTVGDLYKWDRALYTEKLLSKELKEKMFTPFLANYAYGWGVNKREIPGETDSVTVIAHSGGINGFNTLIFRIVDDEHLIVLLNNSGPTRLGLMARDISYILYDKPYELPKMPVAIHLAEAGSVEELDKRIAAYWDNESEFDIVETEINTLGYQWMRSENLEKARRLFEMNVKAFPKSANVYDSLAESYLEGGNKAKAIELYKKALEIDPRFQNAKNMLEKIGVKVDESMGKEISVAPEILKKYVGQYQLQPGFIFTVTLDADQLMVQLTGQPSFPVFAENETMFFYKVVNARIHFNLKEDGTPKSLTLFQGGREMESMKIE